jgi:predicted DsbA family dithiol-disulfide isomerase
MPEPVHIAMYSDIACPYAYLSAYRLRKLREGYQGLVVIEHKSLALEYRNQRATPKPVLDHETPFIVLEEPEIAYRPWIRAECEWPVTIWPAFEAVKCAERQSWDLADDLDWALRVALFASNYCISMRHIIFELAETVGLDMARFVNDFDRGVAKFQVLQEAQEGWEQLEVRCSPTFVLPSGKQMADPGLPRVELDAKQHYRVISYQPATCQGDDCLEPFRRMFAEAGVPGPHSVPEDNEMSMDEA